MLTLVYKSNRRRRMASIAIKNVHKMLCSGVGELEVLFSHMEKDFFKGAQGVF